MRASHDMCFHAQTRVEHGATYVAPLDRPCTPGNSAECLCFPQRTRETSAALSQPPQLQQEPFVMAYPTTTGPAAHERDAGVQSTFAIWTWPTSGTTRWGSDTCATDVPAMIEVDLSPQIVFCSDWGIPPTKYYSYKDWPATGCQSRSRETCCPSDAPMPRTEYFNGGQTAIQYCATSPQASVVTDLLTTYSGLSLYLTPYTYTAPALTSSSTSSPRSSTVAASTTTKSSSHTSSGTTPATSSSGGTAASGQASASASTGPATGEGGLDTGAKVGLGVGVTLGVLLLLAIGGVIFYLRRLHRKRQSPAAGSTFSSYAAPSTAYAASRKPPSQLNSDHDYMPTEMNGDPHYHSVPSELAGSRPLSASGRPVR